MAIRTYTHISNTELVYVLFNEGTENEVEIALDRAELRHLIQLLDEEANYQSL